MSCQARKGKVGMMTPLLMRNMHRGADNAHPIDHLFGRQRRIVARSEHSDLVARWARAVARRLT